MVVYETQNGTQWFRIDTDANTRQEISGPGGSNIGAPIQMGPPQNQQPSTQPAFNANFNGQTYRVDPANNTVSRVTGMDAQQRFILDPVTDYVQAFQIAEQLGVRLRQPTQAEIDISLALQVAPDDPPTHPRFDPINQPPPPEPDPPSFEDPLRPGEFDESGNLVGGGNDPYGTLPGGPNDPNAPGNGDTGDGSDTTQSKILPRPLPSDSVDGLYLFDVSELGRFVVRASSEAEAVRASQIATGRPGGAGMVHRVISLDELTSLGGIANLFDPGAQLVTAQGEVVGNTGEFRNYDWFLNGTPTPPVDSPVRVVGDPAPPPEGPFPSDHDPFESGQTTTPGDRFGGQDEFTPTERNIQGSIRNFIDSLGVPGNSRDVVFDDLMHGVGTFGVNRLAQLISGADGSEFGFRDPELTDIQAQDTLLGSSDPLSVIEFLSGQSRQGRGENALESLIALANANPLDPAFVESDPRASAAIDVAQQATPGTVEGIAIQNAALDALMAQIGGFAAQQFGPALLRSANQQFGQRQAAGGPESFPEFLLLALGLGQ